MPNASTSQSGLLRRIGNNANVKTRILAGFGLVLIVLAIVAGSAYFSLERTNHEFGAYGHAVEVSADAARIEIDAARFRRHMETFLRTGSAEEAQAALTEEEKLSADVAKGETLATTSEEKSKFAHLGGVIGKLAGDFHRLIELEEHRARIASGTLETAGPSIAASVEKLIQAAARDDNADALTLANGVLAATMTARLHASLVLDRRESGSSEAADAAFEQLTALLGQLGSVTADPAQIAEISESIADYRQAYAQSRQIDQEIRTLVEGPIASEGAQIIADAEAIKKAALKEERTINAETHATIANAELLALAMGGGGILLGLALAWLIGSGIARPVVAMTAAMRRLADGDHDLDIPAQERGDEIGQMAVAVEVFKQNAIRVKRLAEEQRQEEERKATRQKVIDTSIASFQDKVGGILGTLASASTEMQHTAESMSATAEETARQSTAVSAASEQATVSVQTVASASEELAASVHEIGRQVEQSTRIAGDAVQQVEETHVTVRGLAEAAQKIGDVVQLINDIASQTNLLALNATIEAARAGEAGKGFAVVASEVKNLATQTARATEDIGAQISGIQQATSGAVKAIDGIGGVIMQVSEIASAIAGAVEEQAAATQEISQNVQQAAAGTSEVSANISGVAQAAADTGAASSQVLATAGELARQSEVLRGEVDAFLSSVRSA